MCFFIITCFCIIVFKCNLIFHNFISIGGCYVYVDLVYINDKLLIQYIRLTFGQIMNLRPYIINWTFFIKAFLFHLILELHIFANFWNVLQIEILDLRNFLPDLLVKFIIFSNGMNLELLHRFFIAQQRYKNVNEKKCKKNPQFSRAVIKHADHLTFSFVVPLIVQ